MSQFVIIPNNLQFFTIKSYYVSFSNKQDLNKFKTFLNLVNCKYVIKNLTISLYENTSNIFGKFYPLVENIKVIDGSLIITYEEKLYEGEKDRIGLFVFDC